MVSADGFPDEPIYGHVQDRGAGYVCGGGDGRDFGADDDGGCRQGCAGTGDVYFQVRDAGAERQFRGGQPATDAGAGGRLRRGGVRAQGAGADGESVCDVAGAHRELLLGDDRSDRERSAKIHNRADARWIVAWVFGAGSFAGERAAMDYEAKRGTTFATGGAAVVGRTRDARDEQRHVDYGRARVLQRSDVR